MAHGFNPAIKPSEAFLAASPDILRSRAPPVTKCRLALILRSKAISSPVFAPVYLYELLFVRHENDKGGKVLSLCTIIFIHTDAWTVTAPARDGNVIWAATEDIHTAIFDDSFLALMCKANNRPYWDNIDLANTLQNSVVTSFADLSTFQPDWYHDYDEIKVCSDTLRVRDPIAVY